MLNIIGTCTCRETIQTLIPCPHILKVLNSVIYNSSKNSGINIDDIFIPKFFGELFFTEKWSKIFNETVTVIPNMNQIETFKNSKPVGFFKACKASFEKTDKKITGRRILSTGEKRKKKSGAIASNSLEKRRIRCPTCGKYLCPTTRHTQKACLDYQNKNPKYHLELKIKDTVAQNNFDSHDTQLNDTNTQLSDIPLNDIQKDKKQPEVVPERTITQIVYNNLFNLFN